MLTLMLPPENVARYKVSSDRGCSIVGATLYEVLYYWLGFASPEELHNIWIEPLCVFSGNIRVCVPTPGAG